MLRRLLLLGLALVPAFLSAQSYWDDPRYVLQQGARFPTAVDNGTMAAAFWQERDESTATGGWSQSFLSVSVRRQGDADWTTKRKVLGPFTQVGAEAQYYSAVLTKTGVLWLAVLTSEGQLTIYRSDDGLGFEKDSTITGTGNLLVPRLFLTANDEPLLIVNQADKDSFRLFSSRRVAGHWTGLGVVNPEEDQRQSFQPVIARNGDRLTMVYQTLFTVQLITYQVFRKDSYDGGATWGPAVRLSGFADDLGEADAVDNQRPSAYWFNNRLFVAWERRTSQTDPRIEVATYSADGRRLDAQPLTQGFRARSPLFYTFKDKLNLTWFDNRQQTYAIYNTTWDPVLSWDTPSRVGQLGGDAVFEQPASIGDELYFFWQSNFAGNPGIVLLAPDRRADPPVLRAVNFKPDSPTNKSGFTVEVGYPHDISGIKGFSALLTQDPAAEPEHVQAVSPADRRYSVTVPAEGTWYVAVSVEDMAGNWSPPTRMTLRLKTTPPGAVAFDDAPQDDQGFLTSNTFQITWKPTTEDASSYSWKLVRVGDAGAPAPAQGVEPAASPTGTEAEAGANNADDGLWVLSVAAFDDAGNRGPVTSRFFKLNKFIPYTAINVVDTQQDIFGRVSIVIHGRGYTARGVVNHIYLDRDGAAPFDYDFTTGFHVASDRLIDGIQLNNLAEGVYRVGVNHPERGRLFTGLVLKVEASGTVKVGDFRALDQTVWDFFDGVTVFFSVHAVYFWAVMLLLAAGGFGSSRLLASAWSDRLRLDRQAAFLFSDKSDKWARRAGRAIMRTKGLSLTVKFAASILGLTLTVILMLAITLGFFITENSQLTLGTALEQRTQVLLDGLATGARTYLPTANYTELGNLPQQTSAMGGEALYATITGPSSEKKAGLSYVYASNDPDLKKKIDTDSLQPGISVLKDDLEPVWASLQKDLDKQAEAAVGELARQIETLTAQARPLAVKTDAASIASVRQYDQQISALKLQVSAKLAEIGGKARTLPAFDPHNLLASKDKRYLFYQPFLYLTVGQPTYVRGLIRIEVSSDRIEKQIADSRGQLIAVTVVVALIALVLGLAGAFLLSALTINPIRKLVAGVEKIRDTDDKAELADHVIEIGTRDELDDLASTINQMTQGLVTAAEANKDLLLGKTTQKTFVPLDTDDKGRKMTTGYLDLPSAEIFGYYEGAKGVSGDYYDFRQLDNKDGDNPASPWYGFIKCDVSGKGIVGALIMFTVASVVVNFFRNWTAAKDSKNIQLTGLVANVNDLLESLRFQGRFAALNVGIVNVQTGKIRLCHAGDNVVHVWRGKKGVFETTTLPGAPATGQIADFMARSLYKHHDLTLESGDTLLFYTDGIEESQSKFRDENYNVIAFSDPDDPSTKAEPATGLIDNEPLHEPSTPADPRRGTPASEGNERIDAIIEAFYRRETYKLVKKYPANPEETFTFDFSKTQGTAREAVTALISIDRIFRLVADPQATPDDRIKLDIIQKEFLEKHFVEYAKYFHSPTPDPEFAEYVWFDHLKEDDQFDDLTLLAIRKK
jgi:hypothetical protein